MEFERKEPKVPKSVQEKELSKRVVIVLDDATLETAKIGGEYQLLNSEDHKTFLSKNKKDPAEYRPDITHQCLLTLLDSPLNKAGLLQVYIRTRKNVLIEVSPKCRIPRTFSRFAGLMVQLLHKLKIRATNGPDTLLQIIRNPVESHFPANCRKFELDERGRLVSAGEFAKQVADGPIVFVVGAFANGTIRGEFCEEKIAISSYALSASGACGKLCDAFETKWDIL
nr:ribosomal RNA small subunit methyltransferase NEP1 [Andalucia godoyi]|eukprot:ANDGO_01485.mRNA.1 Ribosomal RNA small subunit methyltransferase NEP1